jgi:hypothetical protein
MLFSRFTQSAVALALLTIGFAAPVHAQNNKQIISGTWYEDRAIGGNNAAALTLTFTQTPSDKFLNITNISCNVTTSSGQIIDAMNLFAGTTSGNNDLNRPYEIRGSAIPETSGTSKSYSIVTNQVFFKFGPGRFPSILIETVSSGSLETIGKCVIVGNLSDS